CAGVARVLPGIALPGVVAEFAWMRNRAERPELFARADVVAADIRGDVLLRDGSSAALQRRAGDDGVPNDDRRRAGANQAGLDRQRTVEPFGQVDDAALSEILHSVAGLGVERNELEARRDHDDPLIAFAIRPISNAAILQASHDGAAFALIDAIHPQRLAGCGVDRDSIAPRAGGHVKNA